MVDNILDIVRIIVAKRSYTELPITANAVTNLYSDFILFSSDDMFSYIIYYVIIKYNKNQFKYVRAKFLR